jgi:hypothetical protein
MIMILKTSAIIISLILVWCCGGDVDNGGKLLSTIKADSGSGSAVNVVLKTEGNGPIVAEKTTFTINVKSNLGSFGLLSSGDLILDNKLNFDIGQWDGKKEGATHTLKGRLTIYDYEFNSDEQTPLQYKMTKDGYRYVSGSGTVKNLKTGKVYNLK